MSRAVTSIITLTLVYAMLLGSFDPWDLAIGAVLSSVLLFGSRRFLFNDPMPSRRPRATQLLAAIRFVVVIARDVTVGTWQVASIVLRLRPLAHPGIVQIPIGDRTPTGVAVSALATTLSPGTFLIDVDWNRGVMLLHVLDASDPDAVRAAHEHFYRRYQRHLFP